MPPRRLLLPPTLRGQVLLEFGLALGFVGGINYLATTIPEPTRDYIAFALRLAPPSAIGWAWIIVGAFATISAYSRKGWDSVGYKLAAVACWGWAAVYVSGFLFYGAAPRALGGSVIWFLFGVILSTCARIPGVTRREGGM